MRKVILCVIIIAEMLLLSLSAFAFENISDDDIKELFLRASWARAWWDGDSDMDNENEVKGLTRIKYPDNVAQMIELKDAHGKTEKGKYYIVPFEEINTKGKMRSYLMRFFTPETVDRIMKKEMPFIEGENGYLYKFPGYVRQFSGVTVYEPSDYEIISKTDKKIVLRVFANKSEYPDKYYDYTLAKNGSGDWIFSKYVNYRFLISQNANVTADDLYEILDCADRAVTWTLPDGGPDFSETYGVDETDSFTVTHTVNIDGKEVEREYIFKRVKSEFGSKADLIAYFGKYMSRDAAIEYIDTAFDGKTVFKERDGKLYFNSDNATLYTYKMSKDTDHYEIIKNEGERIILRYYPCYTEEANRYNYTMNRDLYYDYIFEFNANTGYIVINPVPTLIIYQGTDAINSFKEDLTRSNPVTSDSAVYITAAAGVIALCCAIVCKKKLCKV